MVDTLTSGADTITPRLINGYEADSESATISHEIIDGPTSHSLADDRALNGDLKLVFDAEADAWAARALLAQPRVWTLNVADPASVAMTFVRKGRMRIEQAEEYQDVWLLSVGFEVST